jgi:hypothetical protein
VDDGTIITSSNLTSGIDAALHVVDRFAGRATALDVARQIGYSQTRALDDPSFDAPADTLLARGYMAGLEGPKQRIGVLLYDGVTELGLSGILDPYLGSFSAKTVVVAPERRIVRSRNGFLFVPRYDFGTVPTVDRVLLPAGDSSAPKEQTVAAWSTTHREPVEDLYRHVGSGETAYDATVRDLARNRNGTVARLIADTLFYTAAPSDFSDAAWPIRELLAAFALGLIGATLVYAASHLRVPRKQTRFSPATQPA